MDFIDKFRHWLIRKLSCGDMVLMNFEIRSDGSFISKNLGPTILRNADVTVFDAAYAIYIGRGYKKDACIGLASHKNIILDEVYVRVL